MLFKIREIRQIAVVSFGGLPVMFAVLNFAVGAELVQLRVGALVHLDDGGNHVLEVRLEKLSRKRVVIFNQLLVMGRFDQIFEERFFV